MHLPGRQLTFSLSIIHENETDVGDSDSETVHRRRLHEMVGAITQNYGTTQSSYTYLSSTEVYEFSFQL